jgi:hypothetical protein
MSASTRNGKVPETLSAIDDVAVAWLGCALAGGGVRDVSQAINSTPTPDATKVDIDVAFSRLIYEWQL